MEKAAAVIACPSTIVAVAILHFNCAKNCDKDATVTIFFDKNNKTRQGQTELEAWGKEKAEADEEKYSFQYRTQSNP